MLEISLWMKNDQTEFAEGSGVKNKTVRSLPLLSPAHQMHGYRHVLLSRKRITYPLPTLIPYDLIQFSLCASHCPTPTLASSLCLCITNKYLKYLSILLLTQIRVAYNSKPSGNDGEQKKSIEEQIKCDQFLRSYFLFSPMLNLAQNSFIQSRKQLTLPRKSNAFF